MLHRSVVRTVAGVIALSVCSSVMAQVAFDRARGSGAEIILVAYALGAISVLAGILLVKFGRREKSDEKSLSPPLDFHRRLGEQIRQEFASGTEEVEIQARSITSLAEEYREALDTIRRFLNSEIDRLMAQTRDLQGLRGSPTQQEQVRASVEQTLIVLRRTWPDKQARIELELRKLEATTTRR